MVGFSQIGLRQSSLVGILLILICASAKSKVQHLDALKRGYWKSNSSLSQSFQGDTVIFSKSETRIWKFKPNGNVKGWDLVLYCGNTPKWQRRRNPVWSKFGTWSTEVKFDVEYLHLDLYTGNRLFRYISSNDSSVTLLTLEAPEKK